MVLPVFLFDLLAIVVFEHAGLVFFAIGGVGDFLVGLKHND